MHSVLTVLNMRVQFTLTLEYLKEENGSASIVPDNYSCCWMSAQPNDQSSDGSMMTNSYDQGAPFQ